jgi:hypothetical protein
MEQNGLPERHIDAIFCGWNETLDEDGGCPPMIGDRWIMMKTVVAAAAIVGVALIAAAPAQADGRGRHHHPYRHWDDGPRWRSGVSFYFGNPYIYHRRPPMVVYRHAPPPPVVIYRQPAPQIVYATPPAEVSAVPASPVYADAMGRTCREYQTTLSVGGAAQPGYGTACLQSDGSWRIVR